MLYIIASGNGKTVEYICPSALRHNIAQRVQQVRSHNFPMSLLSNEQPCLKNNLSKYPSAVLVIGHLTSSLDLGFFCLCDKKRLNRLLKHLHEAFDMFNYLLSSMHVLFYKVNIGCSTRDYFLSLLIIYVFFGVSLNVHKWIFDEK